MLSYLKQKLIDWCVNKKTITAKELFNSSNPNVVQIDDQNGNLKFIQEGKTDFLIKTPSGFSPIKRTLKTIPFQIWTLKVDGFPLLKAADNHLIMTQIGARYLKDLVPGDFVKTEKGLSQVISVNQLSEEDCMYDLELDDEDHVFYTNGILSHNTTVAAVYMLWFACFHEGKFCVLASKAQSHAVEIMGRIKFAFEELPEWLIPGCKYYSRTRIELENGSVIKSEATSEKTGRGDSPSCVDGNTFITILRNNEIVRGPLQNLFPNLNPHVNLISNEKVLTKDGFKSFSGVLVTENRKTLRLQFDNDTDLICTENHRLLLLDGSFIEAKDLNSSHRLYGSLKLVDKILWSNSQTVFDLLNVEDTHSYVTNSVVSHNCLFIDEIAFVSRRIQEEMWASMAPALSTGGKLILTSTPNGDSDLFATLVRGAKLGLNSFKLIEALWYEHPDRGQEYWDEMAGKLGPLKVRQELGCEFLSSDPLLIDGIKLSRMIHEEPITENMGFKLWKEKLGGAGKIYLMGLDPATGSGSDFSSIEVFEFPSLEQVCELRFNTLNIPLIYSKLKWILKYLTAYDPVTRGKAEVYWSFERNAVGEAIVAMIQNDESEDGGVYLENCELVCDRPDRLGMYTSGKSKSLSCIQLKTLVEKVNSGLKIKSKDLIFELKNFISIGNSYAAKTGCTDDSVMATVIVTRVLQRLSTYDQTAREMVYEQVSADSDQTVEGEAIVFNEPMPFVVV